MVSIICRTMGRHELCDALESAANQSYSPIEIILVDAACLGFDSYREQCAGKLVQIVHSNTSLTRPQAANLGISHAQGDFLLFLDEDDWISHDHVEHLVNFLTAQDEVLAAYSGAQKTDPSGRQLLTKFGRPYSFQVLMRENYIPIHSMLFDQSLIDKGCCFDENFLIFEDWDFWLQISEHTQFAYVDHCTAFYRAGGQSNTADFDDLYLRFDSSHEVGRARSAIYDKWLKRWSGRSLNRTFGEIQHELDRNTEQISTLEQGISNQINRVKQADKQLKESQLEHQKTKNTLSFAINKLQITNTSLHSTVTELRRNLESVLTSRSWRMTRVYRSMGRLLASISGKSLPKPLSVELLNNVSIPSPNVNSTASGELLVKEKPHKNTMLTSNSSSEQVKAAFDYDARKRLVKFLDSKINIVIPSKEKPVLSVIIVLFNQARLSLLCLQALIENADIPYELIIVDNASSDDTVLLLDRINNVKLIRNHENLGFVKAVNQGATRVETEYIVLLNNDAFIEPGAFSAALRTLQEEPNAGAVGGRIHSLDGKLQEAGSIIWRDGSCIGYGRGECPEDGAYRFRRDVDYCSGAFLMFTAKEFVNSGGFDENFSPAYFEETDFCLRLRLQGLRVIYEPLAIIRHYEFASLSDTNSVNRLQSKNQKYFYRKHTDFLTKQRESNARQVLHARTANKFHNLLIIDDVVPHSSMGSGYPRSRCIVKLLSTLPINITFYPLVYPVDNWDAVYRTIPSNVEVVLNKGISGLNDFLTERAGFYQYVMISRATNMSIFSKVYQSLPEQARNFKMVYDAEAVLAGREVLRRQVQGERLSEQEVSEAYSKELSLSDKASTVIAVSAAEEKLFRDYGHNRTVVLGHGIRPKEYQATPSNRNGLLFVGSLKHENSPNVDSVLWFSCNVFPLIEKEIPEIDLQIVGATGAQSLATVERQNIVFKGRLEEICDMYRSCRIFIAPTRFAAGIPHKVHEAAANGIPAIVTSLLAAQLGWKHEQEILVADSPDRFAEECIRLYRDTELWKSLVTTAQASVRRDCSESRFKNTLRKIFEL